MGEHPSVDSAEEFLRKKREEFGREVAEANKERGKALRLLDRETLKTVKKLLQLRDNGKGHGIQLDATKHLSKLQGLEIERHHVSGEDGGPLTIVVKKYERKGN